METAYNIQRLASQRLASSFKLKVAPLFLLLVISYLLFVFSSRSVFAQNHEPTQNSQTVQTVSPSQPQNLHYYTQNVMIEVMAALSCQLTGIDPVNPTNGQCLGIDIKNGKVGYANPSVNSGQVGSGSSGAVGFMGNLIGMTFNLPISTHDYVSYFAGNFGIVKPAYAQQPKSCNPGSLGAGVGFCGLFPLLKVWTAFRNIVYLLFVLIFVLIGLAIMFRVKIDPRTVMTIQNQIPRIIVALILVTLSYAIAGFLIDLMYLFLYLIFEVFAKIPGVHITGLSPENIQNSTPLGVSQALGGPGAIAAKSAVSVGDIIASLFQGTGGRIIAGILLGIIGLAGGAVVPIPGVGSLLGGAIGGALGGFLGNQVFDVLGTVIAFIIIGIAVLFALLRLWFQLLKAYVMLLVDVVFAPFWFLGGLLPGGQIGFGIWFREFLGNLVPFPATLVMFLLGRVFIDVMTKTPGQFVPPFIGNPGDIKNFGALIGLGIILLTPDIVNMMRKALKSPELPIAAIFAAVGAGAGTMGAVPSYAGRIFSQAAVFKVGEFLSKRLPGGGGGGTPSPRQ